MSWVEVDGAGWGLVEMGARFSNTRLNSDGHIYYFPQQKLK